jgi:RND family efflux transporter MFP subunit
MLTRKIKLFVILLLGITLQLSVTSCSGENETKSESMEQIQKSEGVPVVINKVKKSKFEKRLKFIAKFKGYRETIVGAMVGGRIDKILVKPGQHVNKDDIIIEFPTDEPGSQYIQAKAAYDNAEKMYNRMKALYEKGEIAQAKFDGVETQYIVAKQNFSIVKDMLKLNAPYDGTITNVMVHEGDNVKGKAPLFAIADLSKMRIRIWVTADEKSQMKKGMRVFAKANEKTFEGKVSDFSIGVDPMKAAFYADVVFDNSKGEIAPGVTADVEVVTYENDNAIVVPRNVVKTDKKGSFLFLANGNKAVKRYVEISNEDGINYEISKGLKVNDPLITVGIAKLENGTKIKPMK